MNLTRAHKRLIIFGACLLSPMLVSVTAHRLSKLPGPSVSVAAPNVVETSAGTWSAPPLTDRQRRALEYAAGLSSQPGSKSIFFHRTADQPDPPEVETPAAPRQVRKGAELPALMVTSIIQGQNSQEALALINGKVRRIGDSVAPGWRISHIDPDARTVTLTDSQGRATTLRLNESSAPGRPNGSR